MDRRISKTAKVVFYFLFFSILLNPVLTLGDSDIKTVQGNTADKLTSRNFDEYITAAESGDAEAQDRLGLSYISGDGVKKDYHKALEWFRASANQGNKEAQYHLGLVHYFQMIRSGNEDDKAIKLFKKAAKQGHVKAIYAVGVMYYNGYGSEDSAHYDKAMPWLKLSASKGYPLAQNQLGVIYELGRGVGKSISEAKYWYRKSAEQGCRDGINNLARLEKKAEMAIQISDIEPLSENADNAVSQQTVLPSLYGANSCYKQCKLERKRCNNSCGGLLFLGLLAAAAGSGSEFNATDCSACDKYMSACIRQC